MNLKNYINLCLLAKKILIKNKNSINIFAIRQLHLMRPHPVLLKEYYPSEEKFDKEIDGINIIKRIYSLIKDFIIESKKFYSNKSIQNYKSKNNKCLFLTHLINVKHLKNKKDFYFGELPLFLEKHNLTSLIVFRNLTKQTSWSIYDKNKKFFNNKILLSKSLNLIGEFKLISIILRTYFNLIKNKKTDKDLNQFLINKNIFTYSGSTYNNLKLLIQIEEMLKIYKPKYFFLTYEGHAWEKILINQIKKKYTNIKIFAYQFSVVTKYSSSIYLNLGKNFNPNYFLTSGNYTRKTFIKKFQSKIDCLNIGSDKFTKNFPLDLNSKNILVLPEGFNSETIKMIEFTLEAAKKYQDKRFIFRFHPMINKFNFIRKYFGTKLKIPKNIIFSNKSFEEDLKNSKYVLYRGSAAAIQALGANKIVIYMEFNNEINIDPLYMLKKKFYVKKTSQLDKIFKDKKIVQKNAKNIRFTKEYFGEPNFFPLLKYLN